MHRGSGSDTTAGTKGKGNLRLLNFGDLLTAIDEKLVGATATQASWRRLREVTREVGEADTSGFDPIGPEPWRLERLQVSGYRGVQTGDGLTIDFDPTPGITVMHGANGAGKSSIADALRTVLHGGPEEAQGPSSVGNRPLWDPVHVAVGSSEALIAVTLSRGETRMFLTCTLRDSTEPKCSASVTGGDSHEDVELAGEWLSALASYHPVYSYADWERKVQTSGDLRGYLEGMLALGGCFLALHEEVSARRDLAKEAKKRWDAACNSAMEQINVVDQQQRAADEDVLSPVARPTVDTDVDQWLRKHELTDTTELEAEVTESHRLKLEEAARDVRTQCDALASDSKANPAGFAPILAQLYAALAESDHADDTCPVCLSPHTDWRTTLASTVAATSSLTDVERESMVAALMELRQRTATTAEVLGELASLCDDDVSGSIGDFVGMSAEFGETADKENLALSPTVHEQASVLSDWILGEDFEPMMASCIQLTDRRRQWRRARALAVEPFVDTLRQEGPEAKEAALWGDTAKRVDDLQKHLQKEREDALQGQVAPQISELLGDVDMRIDDLAIQKRQAKLALSANSKPLDLGMLSAGQRNAVLLAPLLAVAAEGPFGFLILDDPVHAFDELRLDRLAKTLEPIAKRRRVIVLTHDQRLVEHLRSRPVATTTHSVTRDAVTGEITVRSLDQLWKVLLDDAQTLVDGAAPFPDCQLTVTQAVRGLCRQALDHATRELVVANAVASLRDVSEDLGRFEADGVFATQRRIEVAKTILKEAGTDTTVVDEALEVCAPHFPAWNAASHGNPDTTAATRAEVDAARTACATLAAGAA